MAVHNILITTDGKALTFGRNEKGQLGHGDTTRRDVPTVIEELKEFNIVDGACGKNHTLVLTGENGRFSLILQEFSIFLELVGVHSQ
jgi:alpha-tubulin suppressor-like RCC1 family protein